MRINHGYYHRVFTYEIHIILDFVWSIWVLNKFWLISTYRQSCSAPILHQESAVHLEYRSDCSRRITDLTHGFPTSTTGYVDNEVLS